MFFLFFFIHAIIIVEYWNPVEAQWKSTGAPRYATRDLARKHQFDLIRESGCGGAGIRFRVTAI